ncbi:MAG: ABC transporter substrate-binding protein [Oscillospiraceae bacterium]|nr:ABC transporter substrate-binding protein [Oscillospiraceae bacterium]MDD4367594.1 ABC transporter substrate-binding protein [Oscillospiraceae bacterium]
MKKKTLLAGLTAVAMTLSLLAGCSSTTAATTAAATSKDSSTTAAAATSAGTDSSTMAAAATSEGTDGSTTAAATVEGTPTLDAIKASGKLVMLTNATFPPFEMVDGDEVVGVDVELAQRVADKIGVELEVQDMNFDLLTSALAAGKGDLIAAGMSITPERQEEVDFSTPYVDTNLLIIIPKDSAIAGPDDLAGKTIAVQETTTSDLYVTDNVDSKEVLRFKSAVEAGNAVITGKADAAVIDEMTGQNVVNANADELAITEESLSHEQYAMAVAKGQEDLLAVINEVLAEAVEKDDVNTLISKYMAE